MTGIAEKKLGRVFTCEGCGETVNDPHASTLGECPKCGMVRINMDRGTPLDPTKRKDKHGNTKSERG